MQLVVFFFFSTMSCIPSFQEHKKKQKVEFDRPGETFKETFKRTLIFTVNSPSHFHQTQMSKTNK